MSAMVGVPIGSGRFADSFPATQQRVLLAILILCAHALALLAIMMQRDGVGVERARMAGPGLLVFDVSGASGAEVPTSEPQAAVVPPVASASTEPAPEQPTPPLPTGAVAGDGSEGAVGGASDPFAIVALPIERTAAVGLPVVVIRSTLADLDQAAFAALLAVFEAGQVPAAGSAILRLDVATDGSVTRAAFLGGSLNADAGTALARATERQRLFAPARGARTALLGPFVLPIPKEAAA